MDFCINKNNRSYKELRIEAYSKKRVIKGIKILLKTKNHSFN